MKHPVFNKIPSLVLQICLLITLAISIRFFYVSYTQSVDSETPEISALLFWIFFLLLFTISAGVIFSILNNIRQWKENPKRVRGFIAVIIAGGLLLFVTWIFGNGNPLPLIGYKGSENTYLWLKLTDMWLFSIYILLFFGLIALIGGIVWSLFKKDN